MQRANINLNTPRDTRDVGLDAGGGSRRVTKVQKGRILKGAKRLAKIKQLAKVCKRAKALINIGARPAWQYGIEAYGAADGTIQEIRKSTADATGRPGKQSCPITTIILELGVESDPLHVATTLSVEWWTQMWLSSPSMAGLFRKAWRVAKAIVRHPAGGTVQSGIQPRLVQGDSNNWAKVRGPMATTICNLRRVGWKCEHPDQWEDAQRGQLDTYLGPDGSQRHKCCPK